MAGQGMVQDDRAGYGMVQYDMVYGMTRYGMVWDGMV